MLFHYCLDVKLHFVAVLTPPVGSYSVIGRKSGNTLLPLARCRFVDVWNSMWPCGNASVSRASAVVSPASTSPASGARSIVATSSRTPACERASAVGGAVHSTEALSAFISGTAASRRPVFNSALMTEDFCEATSKMLISP